MQHPEAGGTHFRVQLSRLFSPPRETVACPWWWCNWWWCSWGWCWWSLCLDPDWLNQTEATVSQTGLFLFPLSGTSYWVRTRFLTLAKRLYLQLVMPFKAFSFTRYGSTESKTAYQSDAKEGKTSHSTSSTFFLKTKLEMKNAFWGEYLPSFGGFLFLFACWVYVGAKEYMSVSNITLVPAKLCLYLWGQQDSCTISLWEHKIFTGQLEWDRRRTACLNQSSWRSSCPCSPHPSGFGNQWG